MSINIIAAVSDNGIIGQNGQLPWILKEDLAHFKEVTLGKTVIMGRLTFESLGYVPLANRANIVLTRDVKETKYQATKGSGDLTVTDDLMALIDKARDSKDEYWVIGGAGIYEMFMPFADVFDMTYVGLDVTGEMLTPCKFPDVDSDNVAIISESSTTVVDLATGKDVVMTNVQFERG